MSSFFKSKKSKVENNMLDVPEYASIRKKLASWLNPQIGSYPPEYPGEIVPSLNEYQQKALPYMGQYAQEPITPELVSLGGQEYKKTLTNQYDPSKSLYYKAMRDAANVNLRNTMRKISDSSAGGGRYWTGARLEQQRYANEDLTNALNQTLGRLAENERARRLNIVPAAAQLGEQMTNEPLTRATNILSVGDILRQIQAAQEEAAYNEWLRTHYEYPLKIAQLATAFQGTKPPQWQTTVTPGKPSGFSRMLPVLAGAALGAINPALLGASSMLGGAGMGALGSLTGALPSMMGGNTGLGVINPSAITGGGVGVNTGMQMTPFGSAPTWSPYNSYGRRIY